VVARAKRHAYRFSEYLDLEAASNVKHEFLDGEIYAMAGGTPRHAALTLAVGAALLSALRDGPCRTFSSDLRIRVLETGLAAYPDVAVVCGPLAFDPESDATVTNPTLLVEVLSPSTESFDLGEKFEHYRRIAALTGVLFVSPGTPRMELRSRLSDGTWKAETFEAGQCVPLPALNCVLEVDAVFRDAAV
jgi:Uma2 family endonuclease